MAYSINWHFQDKTEFVNGWQLLWQGKANQDKAMKIRNDLYKGLIKALKPQMLADGRKPNKTNVYHYWRTDEYKAWMPQIDKVIENLKADNDETRKYIALMKETGEYMPW